MDGSDDSDSRGSDDNNSGGSDDSDSCGSDDSHRGGGASNDSDSGGGGSCIDEYGGLGGYGRQGSNVDVTEGGSVVDIDDVSSVDVEVEDDVSFIGPFFGVQK